jgi:hypothetical protein
VSGNNQQWYVLIDGARKGPVAFTKLVALLSAGQLTPDALVWREGLEQWSPANQLTEFVAAMAATAPAPPAIPTPPAMPPQVPPAPVVPPRLPGAMPRPAAFVSGPGAADSAAAMSTGAGGGSAGVLEAGLGELVDGLSLTAEAVRRIVGEATWGALLSAGMPLDATLACLPVLRLRLNDEPSESTASSAMSLLRRVSNKISDLADRGELLGQNFLIDAGRDCVYVAARIVGKSEVYRLQRKALCIHNRWSDEALEIELQVTDSSARVKSVMCRLSAAESSPAALVGSVLPLLAMADDGAPEVGARVFPVLLRSRVSSGRKNTFTTPFSVSARVPWWNWKTLPSA